MQSYDESYAQHIFMISFYVGTRHTYKDNNS
jgi:hypothetical protein